MPSTRTATVSASSEAGPAAAGEPDGSRRPGQVPLRVASYNIHAGTGTDGRFDLDRTAAAIDGLDADVVELQEVDVHWGSRSDWVDSVEVLAQRLGMRAFFGHIYSLDPPAPDQPRREYGLAVLSKWPVVAAENHEITRLSTVDPDPQPRPMPGFPEVVVRKQGAWVHLYVTHLDYRADPAIRAAQVEDTRRIVEEDAGKQRVLVGDFNAEPDAPELASRLRRRSASTT